MTAIIAWFVARRWLWPIGAALAAIALYFGWRHVQRGIGAREVIDEQRKKLVDDLEAAARAARDAGSGSKRDERLRKRFERD